MGFKRKEANCKYNFNDSLFEKIDTPEKAWILGWVASDGSLSKTGAITITLDKKDINVLTKIKNIICSELPISPKKNTNLVSLTINSKKIMNDMCGHLNITYGKKDDVVDFPHHIEDSLKWHFIRGFFEGDGGISNPSERPSPECSIASYSIKMKEAIKDFSKIPCILNHKDERKNLEWSGVNCLDFLGRIYSNLSDNNIRLERKYDLYERWCSWVPWIKGPESCGKLGKLFWMKTSELAFPLRKERISDSGYDITLIGIHKQIGEVTMYSTGIKISPPNGIYFDLVPRSSIIKSGYILANNIGVIDRSYRGEILVPLIKIDKSMPDLPLPSRIVQLIPRLIPHIELVRLDDLEETPRGSGGFGSTDKKS
jgi:deoxyuridine 5'-triphosphate nucleotidohydrolase